MSEMLGANPEDLRSLAEAMDQGANRLDAVRTGLANTFKVTRWHGPDAQQAINRFNTRHAMQLQDAAVILQQSARDLRRNAAEQDKASAAEGGPIDSPSTPDLPPSRWPDLHTMPAYGTLKTPNLSSSPSVSLKAKGGGSDSITYGPDGMEVSNSQSVGVDGGTKLPVSHLPGLKDVGLGGGISTTGTVASGVSHTKTSDTYKISTKIETEGHASVDLKKFGLNGSLSAGQKFEYSVTVPKGIDPLSINPNDPSSWPSGTSVKVNASDQTGNSVGIKYGVLGLDGKVTNSDGTSQIITKDDDGKVTVMTGPTAAVSNKAELSVTVDEAKLMLSTNKSLTDATLQTASFDPATPEGDAALNNYLTHGSLPSADGPGISEVNTVSKVSYSSGHEAGLKLFDFSVNAKDAPYSSEVVTTTHGDGSSDQQLTVKNPGCPDLIATQTFDPDGKLDPSSSTYTYLAHDMTESDAQLLNNKDFSGFNGGGFQAGDNVKITLTLDQVAEFKQLAETAQENIQQTTGGSSLLGGAATESDRYFALLIQQSGQSIQGVVGSIAEINREAEGMGLDPSKTPAQFPGTVTKVK